MKIIIPGPAPPEEVLKNPVQAPEEAMSAGLQRAPAAAAVLPEMAAAPAIMEALPADKNPIDAPTTAPAPLGPVQKDFFKLILALNLAIILPEKKTMIFGIVCKGPTTFGVLLLVCLKPAIY